MPFAFHLKIVSLQSKSFNKHYCMMNKKVFILLFGLLLSCGFVSAQDVQKSDLQQRAEADLETLKYKGKKVLLPPAQLII